jgi:hypothetical protein
MQQIEKLSEYVAKNGAEFEELTRQKSLDMFWWLNDFNSNEYKMYKRLLESKIGIPNSANHNSSFSPTTIVQQPPSTMPVTNNIDAQIEEAKLRAQKLLESRKESKLEYVEDTTLFDNIVGNIPQNTRIANAGFQKGTYNAIDLLTAPKNVNEEIRKQWISILRNEWNYLSTSWNAQRINAVALTKRANSFCIETPTKTRMKSESCEKSEGIADGEVRRTKAQRKWRKTLTPVEDRNVV